VPDFAKTHKCHISDFLEISIKKCNEQKCKEKIPLHTWRVYIEWFELEGTFKGT